MPELGTIHLFRPASYFTSELYSSSATKDIITPPFNSVRKYQEKHWTTDLAVIIATTRKTFSRQHCIVAEKRWIAKRRSRELER